LQEAKAEAVGGRAVRQGSSLPAAEVTVAAPDSLRVRIALAKLESALHQEGVAMKRLPPGVAPAHADIVVRTGACW
jgi:hypothetical protein